jgi:hypothetical protein
MNDLKAKWNTTSTPAYSEEELISIYNIKKDHSFRFLKAKLGWDLVVAEILVLCFIIFLQTINLSLSNFWTMIMGFVGLQHLLLYQLQAKFIKNRLQFTENLSKSLEGSRKLLKALLWHYRIWPATLSLLLYGGYYFWFTPDWSALTLTIQGFSIVLFVLGVSNLLSALMVRKQIDHLTQLLRKLEKTGK